MAKGSLAKEEIFSKILEIFDGSFIYNNGKEVRIPWKEGDNLVQIKVTLTCAKDNVSPTGDETVNTVIDKEEASIGNFPTPKKRTEVTEEEKKNVEDLLSALGLN